MILFSGIYKYNLKQTHLKWWKNILLRALAALIIVSLSWEILEWQWVLVTLFVLCHISVCSFIIHSHLALISFPNIVWRALHQDNNDFLRHRHSCFFFTISSIIVILHTFTTRYKKHMIMKIYKLYRFVSLIYLYINEY